MKSRAEVTKRLREYQQMLAETKQRFAQYDNSEDMDAIAEYRAIIAELEWVLGK